MFLTWPLNVFHFQLSWQFSLPTSWIRFWFLFNLPCRFFDFPIWRSSVFHFSFPQLGLVLTGSLPAIISPNNAVVLRGVASEVGSVCLEHSVPPKKEPTMLAIFPDTWGLSSDFNPSYDQKLPLIWGPLKVWVKRALEYPTDTSTIS